MKAECSLLFEWLVSLFENKNKTEQQKKSENLNMYERNKLKKKHHQLVQKGHILDNQNHFLRKNQIITEPKINLKVIMYART